MCKTATLKHPQPVRLKDGQGPYGGTWTLQRCNTHSAKITKPAQAGHHVMTVPLGDIEPVGEIVR